MVSERWREMWGGVNRSTIGPEKNGLDSIETGATNGLHWPVHKQRIQIYSDVFRSGAQCYIFNQWQSKHMQNRNIEGINPYLPSSMWILWSWNDSMTRWQLEPRGGQASRRHSLAHSQEGFIVSQVPVSWEKQIEIPWNGQLALDFTADTSYFLVFIPSIISIGPLYAGVSFL